MLGERIAKARKDAGFSDQKSLAEKIKVGARTLADYETNNSEPKASTLKLIAENCNISIDYLLHGKQKDLSISDNVKKRTFTIATLNGDLDYIILDKKLYAFFADNPTLKAFKMTDNTMETYISKDAWIIIDTSVHNFTDIGYYLVEENEKKTIRYITKNKDTLELHSHNPKLTQTRNKDEVKILGIELHIIR